MFTIVLSIMQRDRENGGITFQKSWFKEYKWLTYCNTHNVTYCFYCRKAKLQGCLTFSKRAEDAFISKGFNNWKKAKEK